MDCDKAGSPVQGAAKQQENDDLDAILAELNIAPSTSQPPAGAPAETPAAATAGVQGQAAAAEQVEPAADAADDGAAEGAVSSCACLPMRHITGILVLIECSMACSLAAS
jgi:hypothetical protein